MSVCLRLLADYHVSDICYVQTKCSQTGYYVRSKDSFIKYLLNTCSIPGTILGPGN